MLHREQKFTVALFLLYLVSWVLPTGFNDSLGYQCALLAHKFMLEGMDSLKDMVTFNKSFSLSEIRILLWKILVGTPNILFIISLLLFRKGHKSSFYFIGPCVVGMLYWIIGGYKGIGYYLWLMSGLGLFFLSAMEYSKQTGVKGICLFVSKGACIMYVAIGIIILAYIPR